MSVAIGTAQPSLPAPPGVEAGVDGGGDDHAAQRCDHRQGYRSRVAQLPVRDLALDLHAHEQEEHGHQCVVDPCLQRQVVEVQQVAELDPQRVCHTSTYESLHGELAHTMAISAATSMTTPPAAS
jgi:hypothetical protein